MILLPEGQYIMLGLRVRFADGDYKTIQRISTVSKMNYRATARYLINGLALKAENYKKSPIKNLIFTYVIIPDAQNKVKKPKFNLDPKQVQVPTTKLWGYSLPNTMDFLK